MYKVSIHILPECKGIDTKEVQQTNIGILKTLREANFRVQYENIYLNKITIVDEDSNTIYLSREIIWAVHDFEEPPHYVLREIDKFEWIDYTIQKTSDH